MEELSKLSDIELKEKLARLKEDLEDVENERSFIFKQSGMHVSSGKIVAQMEEFDSESKKLKAFIAECDEEMSNRGL
jgi:preprotein translocase subunit SecA